ncbi:hypothetical protein BC830DRAFT_285518 [Chytriomyces sp. MP71]|nr:hypothetical protein BC830DRAFT_285518 [Chytriomyces sp. MP71]
MRGGADSVCNLPASELNFPTAGQFAANRLVSLEEVSLLSARGRAVCCGAAGCSVGAGTGTVLGVFVGLGVSRLSPLSSDKALLRTHVCITIQLAAPRRRTHARGLGRPPTFAEDAGRAPAAPGRGTGRSVIERKRGWEEEDPVVHRFGVAAGLRAQSARQALQRLQGR